MSKIYVKHDELCIFDFNSIVNIEFLHRCPSTLKKKQKTLHNIDA